MPDMRQGFVTLKSKPETKHNSPEQIGSPDDGQVFTVHGCYIVVGGHLVQVPEQVLGGPRIRKREHFKPRERMIKTIRKTCATLMASANVCLAKQF